MSGGDFLSRWSRRKLDVRRGGATDEPAPPEQAPDTGDVADAAGEELSAEELAALPPVESLTAESDIGAFLRKGVPQALRNAALRRMWALDPEIRDYVGDARDYAYDWNVPGGVPGTGPIEETADIGRMVEEVFGRPADPDSPAAPAPVHVAAANQGAAAGERPAVAGSEDAPVGGSDTPQADAQGTSTCREERPIPARIRHGGAKPT